MILNGNGSGLTFILAQIQFDIFDRLNHEAAIVELPGFGEALHNP